MKSIREVLNELQEEIEKNDREMMEEIEKELNGKRHQAAEELWAQMQKISLLPPGVSTREPVNNPAPNNDGEFYRFVITDNQGGNS